MSKDSVLQPVIEHGWSSGFRNMLHKENNLWWGTRKWWVQCILWMGVYNGLIGFILWVIPAFDRSPTVPNSPEMFQMFFSQQGFLSTLGVIVFSHGLIVNEKKFGTAAWVMSSPISRTAFILSKLVGNGLGIFTIIVALPALVAYLQISLRSHAITNVMAFIAGMALICLHLFFYFTLVIMLGTLFNSTGPVLGISIGLLIGFNIASQILASFPWLVLVIPEVLIRLASTVVGDGQMLPNTWPISVAVITVLSFVFILLAVLRFKREEF